MESSFACALDVKASLGECPVWSVDEQALYWIDINAPSLNRFDPAIGTNSAWPMPQAIGCFALRVGGGFVAALRDGIWFVDRQGRLERKIAAVASRFRLQVNLRRHTILSITASMTAAPMRKDVSGREP